MMTDRKKLVELINKGVEIHTDGYQHKIAAAETIADHLLANGVTVQGWRDARTDPPEEYRDECMELIPFLVACEDTELPFRAVYDGENWGDGWSKIPVTHWMPLPEPPKEE